MIPRLASFLLLVTIVPISAIPDTCHPSRCSCNMDVVKKDCSNEIDRTACPVYANPFHQAPNVVEERGEVLKCSGIHGPTGGLWLINGNEYISADYDLECKNNGTEYEWKLKGEVTVYEALCVRKRFCSLTGNLDTTSIPRLIQPVLETNVNDTELLTCPGKSRLHVLWATGGKLDLFRYPLVCVESTGKWKTKKSERAVNDGTKVYCEVPDDQEAAIAARISDDADQEAAAGKEDKDELWAIPVAAALGLIIVLAISTPLSFLLFKITYHEPNRLDKPTPEVWSPHWDEYEEPLDWNWKIVTDFMQNWHHYPVEERAAFLERGYADLGYQATITQMLFLFEFMLIEENHHLVWRPMINFLIRLKRLATPPYTDSELSFRFHMWIAVQGRKLMDEFGYHPFDEAASACTDSDCSRSTCSSSSESECDSACADPACDHSDSGSCSCSDDGEEAGGKKEKSKKEGKKEDKKEGKRGAAGAEDKPAAAAPAEVTAAAPTSAAPVSDAAKPAATAAAPTGGEEPDGEPKKCGEGEGDLEDVDPHDAYLRYIGVFLMTLGGGGIAKRMFDDLDEIYPAEGMTIDGPVRAAMAANRVSRDNELIEFEKIWSKMSDDGGEDEGKSEWGSLTDHYFFALGHGIDDEPTSQLMEFMLKSRNVNARHLTWWFRGANERNSHYHLAFLLNNKKNPNLLRKMPLDSMEFYECLRMYCLFERPTTSWNKIEQLVVKNATLAKRLNVPDYRRRSQHFTSSYLDTGEHELSCWLADVDRNQEIEDADFQPMSTKVISKPA